MEANNVRDLMEAYSSVYNDLDEEMTISHDFRPGQIKAPPAPQLPKPGQTPPRVPVTKKKPINSSVDLFDIIKGHLLDEGYADTEEAAIAIMTSMSEEWRQSIVEGLLGTGTGFLGSNARELGAKGGHDALPWNQNTKYTTKGQPRKPGENVHGEKILNPPSKNNAAMTSDGRPR